MDSNTIIQGLATNDIEKVIKGLNRSKLIIQGNNYVYKGEANYTQYIWVRLLTAFERTKNWNVYIKSRVGGSGK